MLHRDPPPSREGDQQVGTTAKSCNNKTQTKTFQTLGFKLILSEQLQDKGRTRQGYATTQDNLGAKSILQVLATMATATP
jgi:hypothetical protein